MRTRVIGRIPLLIAMFFPNFSNAQYTNWIQFTNGCHITALAEQDSVIWVGTTGGWPRIQMDRNSGKRHN